VEGTPFIPFKTPLRSCVFENSEHPALTVHSLVTELKERGITLGLVIDLTSVNDKYYDCDEWNAHGVQYVKIRCGTSDLLENSKKFIGVSQEYVKEHPDKYIGVHCAHGINRTGYMICSYLITVLKKTPQQAIAAFESSRGHRIETSLQHIHRIKCE
jgi:atypical dual specificity phosphatase